MDKAHVKSNVVFFCNNAPNFQVGDVLSVNSHTFTSLTARFTFCSLLSGVSPCRCRPTSVLMCLLCSCNLSFSIKFVFKKTSSSPPVIRGILRRLSPGELLFAKNISFHTSGKCARARVAPVWRQGALRSKK